MTSHSVHMRSSETPLDGEQLTYSPPNYQMVVYSTRSAATRHSIEIGVLFICISLCDWVPVGYGYLTTICTSDNLDLNIYICVSYHSCKKDTILLNGIGGDIKYTTYFGEPVNSGSRRWSTVCSIYGNMSKLRRCRVWYTRRCLSEYIYYIYTPAYLYCLIPLCIYYCGGWYGQMEVGILIFVYGLTIHILYILQIFGMGERDGDIPHGISTQFLRTHAMFIESWTQVDPTCLLD